MHWMGYFFYIGVDVPAQGETLGKLPLLLREREGFWGEGFVRVGGKR